MQFAKSHPVKNPASISEWLYNGDHKDRCQMCWRPWGESGWLGLQVHHIIHGSNGRSDEVCNLLLVCGRCHAMIHDGQYRDEQTRELLEPITFGVVLWAKRGHVAVPSREWKPKRLARLYHRRLPDYEAPPLWVLSERMRWTT